MISIGGWSYRNNWNFLSTLSDSDLLAWAAKVKGVVDSFNAHGIDIDFEHEDQEQWNKIFV